MATYNVRLYLNTGFNSINIPDSPALLEALVTASSIGAIDVPALDINQERFLPNVRVRATWDNIKNADYCKIGDFFYTINDIQMTSQDVADISLTPDYITSAGGPAALEILDGLTERVHVADDTYGKYDGNDPYMAPSYDMDVMSDTTSGNFYDNGSGYTFLETTLDLARMGQKASSNAVEALTAVDSAQTLGVTFPLVDYIPSASDTNYTAYVAGTSFNLQTTRGKKLIYMDPSASNFADVQGGIALARSLGIEQSISGSYQIPAGMISAPATSGGMYCTSVSGTGGTKMSTIPFVYGAAVQNNRVYYGSETPYTLVSCSGSSMQANAEEIYAGTLAPQILYTCDPRREGKPYFRFKSLQGVDLASNPRDIFRGCVPGLPWRSIPMVFSDKSGSLIDKVNYNASLSKRDMAELHKAEEYVAQQVQAGAGAVAGIASVFGGNLGGVGQAINSTAAMATNALAMHQYNQQQQLDRAIEAQQFGISQSVNVPTVMFPNQPDLMQEIQGNGFCVYRTVYKAADIARIDKILTAFGYRHTKVLEASDFNNRTYFNYVSGTMSVGNLPRWWANGCSSQIGNGVRVWHTKPNHSHYLSNPIRVTP